MGAQVPIGTLADCVFVVRKQIKLPSLEGEPTVLGEKYLTEGYVGDIKSSTALIAKNIRWADENMP